MARLSDAVRRQRSLLSLAVIGGLIAVGWTLCGALSRPPAVAADVQNARVESGERDFGDAVVVFNLEYDDDLVPSVPWAFVRARVERLGNVYFLTGLDPSDSGVSAPRHWVPLSDVVRMTEFESIDSARRAVDTGGVPADREHPVFHRASRRLSHVRD